MAKHTHSDRLERWLGKETVERVSREFKDFYWPIAVHGVPGNVHVMPGGDFTGEIKAGQYFTKEDGATSVMRKILNHRKLLARKSGAMDTLIDMMRVENSPAALSVGAFASVDAIVAAMTGGKGQQLVFSKAGTAAATAGNSEDLWVATGQPAAGAAGAAAPGGTPLSAASTGALGFKNVGTANSGHYLNWLLIGSVAGNSLLLYDRLFSVAKTMNSTATEAVTGVPTRYQSQTTTNTDYIGGNFCFPMNPTTVLPNTSHNWTVCKYTDDAGNTGNNFATGTGVNTLSVGGVDLSTGNWFLGLAAGDVGVKALTQMQCSALVASGTIDFVIGHPIAVNACPTANSAMLDDGLMTALSLTPIFDDACLAFLELPKPLTTATSYSGIVRTVSE